MPSYLRKYGVEATVEFALFDEKREHFFDTAVHLPGDTIIIKDEGAEAETDNPFIDHGVGYSLTLTAAEMTASRITIYIIDQLPVKTWADEPLFIETFGNPSAQFAMDFDDDVAGGMSALPDIQSRLPVALVGGKMSSDAEAVGGSADGANRLGKATQANVFCTVGAGSTVTSIVTSAMDPAATTVDQFKGKIVSFDATTVSVNLRGQSTDITGSSTAGVLEVTALTHAPAAGDVFVIT